MENFIIVYFDEHAAEYLCFNHATHRAYDCGRKITPTIISADTSDWRDTCDECKREG